MIFCTLKAGSTKLEFKYTLYGGSNADYNLYALILHEEDLSVDVVSGRALFKALAKNNKQFFS